MLALYTSCIISSLHVNIRPLYYISDDEDPAQNVRFAVERLEVSLSMKEIVELRRKLHEASVTTHGEDLNVVFNLMDKGKMLVSKVLLFVP